MQDVKAGIVEQHPRLYAETINASHASFFAETLRWVCEALWHSAVALAVPLLSLWAADSSGKSSGGLTAFGTTAYTTIVLIVNLKVRLHNMTTATACASCASRQSAWSNAQQRC